MELSASLPNLPFITSRVAVLSFAGGLRGEDVTRKVGAYPSWVMKKRVLT